MQSIPEILETIKESGYNVQQIARESGIKADKIYKWLEGRGSPKHEDGLKLTKWAGEKLVKIQNAESYVEEPEMINASYKSEPPLAHENSPNVDQTTQALLNLSESNIILARSHEKLVIMLEEERATGRAQKESDEADLLILADLAHVLADVGVSAHKWKTRQEANEELNKLVHDFARLKKIGGRKRHADSGNNK